MTTALPLSGITDGMPSYFTSRFRSVLPFFWVHSAPHLISIPISLPSCASHTGWGCFPSSRGLKPHLWADKRGSNRAPKLLEKPGPLTHPHLAVESGWNWPSASKTVDLEAGQQPAHTRKQACIARAACLQSEAWWVLLHQTSSSQEISVAAPPDPWGQRRMKLMSSASLRMGKDASCDLGCWHFNSIKFLLTWLRHEESGM